MSTGIPIGVNVAISKTSFCCYIHILPQVSTCIHEEGSTYKVYSGRLKHSRSRLGPFLRKSEPSCGEKRDLKQSETSWDFLGFGLHGREPDSKLRRSGVWSISGRYSEVQEVSNEQPAPASEEIEAVKNNLSLGSNSISGDKRIFIFGFGYTSCALASYLKTNWKVSGTCRSEGRRAALEHCGYSAHIFNSDNDGEYLRDGGLRELQEATHWLISVPPVGDCDTDPVLTRHVQDLTQAVGKGNVGWIGYLSSTGVYGDWQGGWVDEQSKPRPVERKALARLAAEEAWLKFGVDNGVPVHVFRLGGIYGPGRSAIDTILRNRALTRRQRSREQKCFTSRIHVIDICQTVLASMQSPNSGKLYNVVDDDQASRLEVWSYAWDLLNNQAYHSHFSKEVASSRQIVGGSNNPSNQRGEKRVSNLRIKVDLKVKLLYPTYREGLKAVLTSEETARSTMSSSQGG